MKRSTFLKFLAASLLVAVSGTSWSQAFPAKPIRIIVPYSPGGLPDTVARVLAKALQEAFGQPVVVENKPGASGVVGATALMQAPADGYTVMLTDGPTLAIAPVMLKDVPYNVEKDFAPVSLVGTAPLFLAVHSTVKVNTLDELIALAKSAPGSLTYGSAGVGGIHHLTAEAMKAGLGLDIRHVPFKGSGNSVPAMIGGQVDMVFASPPSLTPFAKSGQAKLIAINAAKRSPLAPNVPALAEKIPGFDFAFTVVVVAKAGTPKDRVDRIAAEIAKVVKRPEVVDHLQTAGVDPSGGGPNELAAAMKAEGSRVAAAARHANLKPE